MNIAFLLNKKISLTLFILVLALLIANCWPVSGLDIDILAKNLAPCWLHPFGTDWLGRDMLTRTLKALVTSVWIGGLAIILSGFLALLLAMTTIMHPALGYVVELLVDIWMSIPHLLLLILLSLAFGGGETGLIAAVTLTHWPRLTRLLCVEMQMVSNMPYYQLARQFGNSQLSVIIRHILPHLIPQWLIGVMLIFPHALMHMAALTFLGFGTDPLSPTIGGILSQSTNYLLSGQWWLGLFPGASLVMLLLLLAYIVDQIASQLRQGDE